MPHPAKSDASAPCTSADEVARFYERFGAYLAVLHVVTELLGELQAGVHIPFTHRIEFLR